LKKKKKGNDDAIFLGAVMYETMEPNELIDFVINQIRKKHGIHLN
jgi:hypothetical protein